MLNLMMARLMLDAENILDEEIIPETNDDEESERDVDLGEIIRQMNRNRDIVRVTFENDRIVNPSMRLPQLTVETTTTEAPIKTLQKTTTRKRPSYPLEGQK